MTKLLRFLAPYAITAVLVVVCLMPLYQHVREERDNAQTRLVMTQDSLHREQAVRAETEVKFLQLESRDHLIQARYERAMRRQKAWIDSMRGAMTMMTLKQQREYLREKIRAIPRLVREELTDPARYVTPVSYWRGEGVSGLTCYDSSSVSEMVGAVVERDALQETVSVQTESYERLRTQYTEFRTATEFVAYQSWHYPKRRKLRQLLANMPAP